MLSISTLPGSSGDSGEILKENSTACCIRMHMYALVTSLYWVLFGSQRVREWKVQLSTTCRFPDAADVPVVELEELVGDAS